MSNLKKKLSSLDCEFWSEPDVPFSFLVTRRIGKFEEPDPTCPTKPPVHNWQSKSISFLFVSFSHYPELCLRSGRPWVFCRTEEHNPPVNNWQSKSTCCPALNLCFWAYMIWQMFFGSPILYYNCPELCLRSGQPWVFCRTEEHNPPVNNWQSKSTCCPALNLCFWAYMIWQMFFGSPILYYNCPELCLRSGQPWVFFPLAGWNDKQVELHNSRSGLQRLWECSQNKITLNCFSLAEVFSSEDELDYKFLLHSPPWFVLSGCICQKSK